ncbi:MAG: outer membrane protein [Bauldia sp.]
MLRTQILGPSLAALLAGAGLAHAADAPPPYEPPPAAPFGAAPAYSWSGPYAGLTGGYGWSSGTVSGSGWLGGAYAGANFQTGTNLVLGVEGDFTFTGKSGTSGTTTISSPWNSTLRGRVGYATGRVLVYGTGGLAIGQVKAVDTGLASSETSTRLGWTAGAGVDVALTQNLTGRLEYRYTNLGSTTFMPGTFSYASHDVMVGVGFKF